MAQDLRGDQDSLRIMTRSLNSALAEAGAVVQAVDHFLGEELGIGITAASRAFDSQRAVGDDDREMLVTSHLAYGRVSGKNRLYVLTATLDKNEWKEPYTQIIAEERTPWAACSREVKLQSFAMLPELLGSLATRVEEVASQTAKTVEAVRELLDIMRRPLEAPEPVPAGAPSPSPPPPPPPSNDLDLTVTSDPTLFKRPRPR